jgi:DNA-binding MarR family transcriptional regulator
MGMTGPTEHGLTPHQERALLALSRLEAQHHGVRVSHLAHHLGIAPRSATEVADALEAAGLTDRTPDPTDRRAVLLGLTEAGRATVTAVRERRRTVAEQALRTLDDTDRAQLRRLLTALLEA